MIDAAGGPVRSEPAGDAQDAFVWNVFGACFLYRRAVYEAVGPYAEDFYLDEDSSF